VTRPPDDGAEADQARTSRFRTVEWCHSPPRAVRMPRALSASAIARAVLTLSAFGAFHAEIVAKVGALLARLSYSANCEAALQHFTEAMRPDPALGHRAHRLRAMAGAAGRPRAPGRR